MDSNWEERRLIVEKLRPIDDVFFEKLMEDAGVCEEILRIILEDTNLKVLKVIPQGSIKNLQGRSVRLDALCELGDRSMCNIEVQKENDDDHFRRVRYNASCITANITNPGTDFKEVPNLCMIFISRFDIMKAGKTIYHVLPTVQETGKPIDNGCMEIYVNTKVNDGSEIAELMQCFEQEYVENEKFPLLSRRVKQFKGSEKGAGSMNPYLKEYMEKYTKEKVTAAREDGRAEGIEEGKKEGKIEGIKEGLLRVYQNMRRENMPREKAQHLTGIDDTLADRAENELRLQQ